MRLLYRIIILIIIFVIIIWTPIYAFSNALFYSSFASEGNTNKIYIDSIPIGRITNVASGNDIIALYQASWGMVHFYKTDGTYLYTLQLQKPGNGKNNMTFYNHCFYVQQPNGSVVIISTIDESINHFTGKEALEKQNINNAFNPDRDYNENCYEHYGSIWISINGTVNKIINRSFLTWLLTSNAYGYTILILIIFIITTNLFLNFKERKSEKIYKQNIISEHNNTKTQGVNNGTQRTTHPHRPHPAFPDCHTGTDKKAL